MSTPGAELHLSLRLSVIADCVRMCAKAYPQTPRMADIGCDHALVPVSLLLSGDVAFAYASDVREGPLYAAKENAARFGVEDRMRFVLADGLSGIGRNDADICVIAGMGGELVRSILETGAPAEKGISALVLSPHTKQETLRAYLADSAFRIVSEKMTEEDGKYYPVIVACRTDTRVADCLHVRYNLFTETANAVAHETGCTLSDAGRLCRMYGPVLLEERDSVLRSVLEREQRRLARILEQTAAHGARPEETTELMRLVNAALVWFSRGREGEAP